MPCAIGNATDQSALLITRVYAFVVKFKLQYCYICRLHTTLNINHYSEAERACRSRQWWLVTLSDFFTTSLSTFCLV